MLGIFIAILISWVILRFITKENLWVLGIFPTIQRFREFLLGFVIMAFCCAINFLGQAYFTQNTFIIHPEYQWMDGLVAFFWTFKAALFEELIFRGALLYVLIRSLGPIKACWVAAIAFGIYHWFSYGMIGGSLIPMIYIFLLTGASGWMFAYSFVKTRSIYAPLGLHLGWIFTSIVVFSEGPLGDQFLIKQGGTNELSAWPQLLFFSWQTNVIPLMLIFYYRKNYSRSSD